MTRLVRAGFQMLVLGLNLLTIRYILLITLPSPAEVIEKLVVSGAIIPNSRDTIPIRPTPERA